MTRKIDETTIAEASFDPAAFGRAQAAYDWVFGMIALQIEAVRKDCSLTEDRRGAAIAALRMRQLAEARAALRRVFDEESQSLKAARKLRAARAPTPLAP